MTPSPSQNDADRRFADLAVLYLADALTPEQFAQLNQLIADVPSRIRLLVDLSITAESIRRLAQSNEQQESIAEPQEPILAEKIEPALNVSVSGPLSPSGSRGRAGVGVAKNKAARQPRKLTFPSWTYGAAAALLIAAGALVVYLITNTPQSETPNPRSPQIYVALAEITHTDSGVYNFGRQNYVGQPLTYGNISTTHGETEFMLNSRVFVKMQGRGEMNLRDAMNINMTAGTATFTVPYNAHGFTVHLPDGAKVIDLGTKFYVTIDESGETQVRVIEGTVELHGFGQEPILLVEGQHGGIDAAGAVTRASVIASRDAVYSYSTAPGWKHGTESHAYYEDQAHSLNAGKAANNFAGAGVFSKGDLTNGLVHVSAKTNKRVLVVPNELVAFSDAAGKAGIPVDIVVDLGSSATIDKINLSTYVFTDYENGAPAAVTISFSTDNVNFGNNIVNKNLFSSATTTGNHNEDIAVANVIARYVKLSFDGTMVQFKKAGKTPHKYFLDEITISGIPSPQKEIK